MSDLISRQAVIDYLRNEQALMIIESNKGNYDSVITDENIKGALACNKAMMNFILQLPVAYDVDKVIEQLENNCWKDIDNFDLPAIDLDKAVEIVKGAVKDE